MFFTTFWRLWKLSVRDFLTKKNSKSYVYVSFCSKHSTTSSKKLPYQEMFRHRKLPNLLVE